MKDGKMCAAHKVAGLLLFIGGLNWGLVALNAEWDLVAMILGAGSMPARIVYGLVGLSALFMLLKHKCPKCQIDKGMMKKEAAPMNDQM